HSILLVYGFSYEVTFVSNSDPIFDADSAAGIRTRSRGPWFDAGYEPRGAAHDSYRVVPNGTGIRHRNEPAIRSHDDDELAQGWLESHVSRNRFCSGYPAIRSAWRGSLLWPEPPHVYGPTHGARQGQL